MALKNTKNFQCWFIRELGNCFLIWSENLKKGPRIYFSFESFLPIYICSQLIHSFRNRKAVEKASVLFPDVVNHWLLNSPRWYWDHPTQQSPAVFLFREGPGWFCNALHVNQEHFSEFYYICYLFWLFMFWWNFHII